MSDNNAPNLEFSPQLAKEKMKELGLTYDDVLGVNNPSLFLDEEERKHIKSSNEAFNLWLEHVCLHKEMQRLGVHPYPAVKSKSLGDIYMEKLEEQNNIKLDKIKGKRKIFDSISKVLDESRAEHNKLGLRR